MSYIQRLRKFHSDKNVERFNKDLINIREKEDIIQYLVPVCKALEVIPGVEFVSASVEPFNKIYQFGGKAEIDIERSELQIINLQFTSDGEPIELNLYFPKLIDGQYFIINSNRYYPIPQLVDSGVYRTNKANNLRTFLMPIVLRERHCNFEDIDGNEYNLLNVDIDLFRNKIPFIAYMFAKFGYEGTIEYMGLQDIIHILEKDDFDQLEQEDLDDNVFFGITKNIYLVVDKEYYEGKNKNNQIVISAILNMMNNRIRVEKIYDQDYWIKKLGGYFTTNNSNKQEKGENILISFERILEEWSKVILRTDEKNKENIFALLRWMIKNHTQLAKQDNMNLANKRLRIYEYLLYPLMIKFSTGTYRVLNSKNTDKVKSIFKINPGFIVKQAVNNELLRYDNSVNSISLFSSILKFTQGGPQSPFRNANVNIKYRGIHESYLNRISLVSTSAGDPGVSGTLTPFLVLPENSYMHFTEQPEIILEDEE